MGSKRHGRNKRRCSVLNLCLCLLIALLVFAQQLLTPSASSEAQQTSGEKPAAVETTLARLQQQLVALREKKVSLQSSVKKRGKTLDDLRFRMDALDSKLTGRPLAPPQQRQ